MTEPTVMAVGGIIFIYWKQWDREFWVPRLTVVLNWASHRPLEVLSDNTVNDTRGWTLKLMNNTSIPHILQIIEPEN